MKIKFKNKVLLIVACSLMGISQAAYESEISSKSASIKEFTEKNNKETSLPIGHVITGWIGNGYVQSNVNKLTKIYLVNDYNGYPRYSSDWYGNHNSGTYLEGEWQYRGYVSSLSGVSTGLFVRVK